MAIPAFGFTRTERRAWWTLLTVGVVCVALALTSALGSLGELVGGAFPQPWFFANPGRFCLTIHSLLVLLGVVGAWRSRSIILAVVGVVAALAIVTPVGLVCCLPGLWMLHQIAARWRSFFRWPELPPGPSFEELIGERPALVVHVRLDASSKYEAQYTTAETVGIAAERIGGRYLGATFSDRRDCAVYLCAQDSDKPSPEELLAAVEPILRNGIGIAEWRVERRYGTPSEKVDN